MNIKDLTKNYLNTLPGLSEQEKEKIANFNANSDYVAFSARSFRLNPGEMGWVDYDETGIRTWTDYGAPKRVDEQGYTLVDLAEYNPWYTSNDVLNQRKFEDGNYERRNLDGTNYRRSPNGFLEAWEAPKGRWEQLQHAIPCQAEANATWTKGGFFIKTDNLGESPLIDLLETVYCQVHQIERDDADFAGISMINFPEGSVGNLLPWAVKKQTYFKGACRVAVLPRSENERNKWWLTIKKSDLKDQRDPLDEFTGTLNYFATDVRDKKIIKLFPNTASLLEEINNVTQPVPDNTAIQQYNDWIDQKLREFQERFMDLQIECDEKEAFLMSLEKENLPEVREQINIVFSPWEVPKHKKMLTGGAHDPTVEANNQVIETNNTQLIQQLENDFARKRAAIKELGKILESIENPNDPEPDSPPTLQVFRQDAIDAIKTALNRDPKLINDDLDQTCRDWEILINAANNEREIDNIKDKVLIDVVSKRKAKKEEKKVHDNLNTKGKDANQLKRQFEEVEKSRGQSVYETNQTSINSLKEELFKKLSKEEYLQIIVESIEKFLLKCSVGSNDLAPESQRNLQKLKKEVIKDFSQINQAEEEVVKDAGQKGARKKLDLLFRQADDALRTGEKIKEIKNKLNNFRSSNGIYEKSLVSQEAKEIESYLIQLENYSAKEDDSQSPSQENFPWTLVIPILSFIVFIIGVLVIYRKRRKRRTY